MPRRSEDIDPTSLDGVNPREYVSPEESQYWNDLYGDNLVHIASANTNYERALCGRERHDRPLKPDAEVTCVVCTDLKGKAA